MLTDAGTIKASIILNLQSLKTGIKQATNVFKGFSTSVVEDSEVDAKAMQRAWQVGFAILSAAAIKASQAVNRAFIDMIKTFANFEQSLANTQSVARATEEEFTLLEDAARRVGATTRSTASDAANALYYLASAGFSAKEAIAALDGVNALAIATQSDLARTSETVATTIRQYGLEASESTRVANTFTAAITSSLATMNKLTKSFEYLGPIAAGLGISVEETTGALQVLYNKGFSGEKAGRGLRTILVNLADSTSVVNKRLARLGITFDQINPTTNSLADIFDTLRENEVNATNAAAIFGKVSGVQLASLVADASTAKGGIVELTEAVTGTNRAFEAMAIQMDTLQGSFDKFKNAQEALKISTGKGLEPVLRPIVDIATSLVVAFNKLPSALLATGATLAVVATGAVALAAGITTVISVLAVAAGVTLPILAIFGTLAGILAGVTIAAIGLAKGFDLLKKAEFKRLDSQFRDIAESTEVANENTNKFYKNAEKAKNSFDFVPASVTDDIDKFKLVLQRTADTFGLTFEQAVKVAQQNKKLSKQARINLGLLEQDIHFQKMRRDVIKENAIAMAKNTIEYTTHLEKMKQLNAQYLNDEAELERNTAEAYLSLRLAFERAAEYKALLGDEYDRNVTLRQALKDSIKNLIDQGYTAESKAVQDLFVLYNNLESATEKVGKAGLTDSEVRAKAQADLAEQFKQIAEQEKLAILLGTEYNAEQERSQAVLSTINGLIQKNFTIQGGGIQRILGEYSKYVVALEEVDTLYASYKTKVDALILTQTELIENERDAEIAKAKANNASQKSIDLLNEYYDLLQSNLAEQQQEKMLAMYNAYNEKILALQDNTDELRRIEHKRAVEAAEGNLFIIEAINEYYDLLEKQDAFDKFIENFSKIVDYSKSAIDSLSTIYGNYIDKQITKQEELLDIRLAQIDAEEQAALEAAGVAEQTKIEALEAELAALIETGDAASIAAKQDEIDRYNIKQEYDEKRRTATDAANKEIAKLNYKSDLASWRANLLNALASAALAILKGYKDGGVAGGLIMAGLTGLQVAAVSSAKPEEPKFNDGGIVPGSSTRGDRVRALVNSGELILSQAQQSTVANKLATNEQPIVITSPIYLDGKLIATNSAKYYRNGQVKL